MNSVPWIKIWMKFMNKSMYNKSIKLYTSEYDFSIAERLMV